MMLLLVVLGSLSGSAVGTGIASGKSHLVIIGLVGLVITLLIWAIRNRKVLPHLLQRRG